MLRLLPLLLPIALSLSGCAPYLLVPAEGSKLAYDPCFVSLHGITVRAYEAECPDFWRVYARTERVLSAFPGCSLDGVEVYVVGAYVICNEEERIGCYVKREGHRITVAALPRALSTLQHELVHVCLDQKYSGADSLEEFDHDRPPGERWWREGIDL